ncbi:MULTISPECIES: GvpL/GvpF family gas vesicle protein [unclassified Streptomyces]|uniref:GvpL/GvpF family gas vesicle protein n=1 Tax=unclassified Streptomyces TaxID=2593676 RepID=UPI00331F76BC
MPLYVYTITAATHPCRTEGLTGVGAEPSPLRQVVAGPLRAVVSDVDEEIRPRRRDLAAHQEVQERLMAQGTVLPLQFGYVAPDDQAVAAVLEERADAYLDALERVRGCAEYHVRAAQEEDALLREILRESPRARELNDRIRAGDADPRLPLELGEIVATEVRTRQEALASGLVGTLIPFARDHSVRAPADGDLLNLSLLVHDDDKEDFLRAGSRLAEQTPTVTFRFNGPLPPYSFV